jgi:D-cysteine desulfhydrase
MQLARFPRRRYTDRATPIEPLPHLGERLGGPRLFIKRDDLLGLAAGGNKTRKLEFLVADAIARGADTLVTCGAVQSNHCRLTVAAAIREGLRCRLVLEERVPGSYHPEASGNHFLFRLLGVEGITVVPAGADLAAAMQRVADEVAADGGTAYVIPGGGSNALGALGYVACARETVQQAFDAGLAIDHLVCASGSGGTHAGLLAGMAAIDADIAVTGISVRHPRARQEEWIATLTREVRELLGLEPAFPRESVRVEDGYVGEGYSLPTAGMREAVQMLARLEGILLDPVYTGKAMAGLIDLVRSGRFRSGETVLFLHTGGAPALYAYGEAVLQEDQPAGASAAPDRSPGSSQRTVIPSA